MAKKKVAYWKEGHLFEGGSDYSLILVELKEIKLKEIKLNPFTPTSDQDRISPYNINTISGRQVMRIEKNINDGIIS